jgi:hypothetical protein
MPPACPAPLDAERDRVLPGCVYTAMQTWKTPNGLEPKTPVETYKGDGDDWSTSACTLPPFARSGLTVHFRAAVLSSPT